MCRRLWLLMITGLAWAPWSAWAEPPNAAGPQVQVERKDDLFHVEAEATVAVDMPTAWQVLTDYNHIAEFVRGMQSSRIISAVGEPLRIEQKGETGWLFFAQDFDVVLELEELPPGRLKFHAASGSMKRMDGEWRIHQTEADTIGLEYTADIEPGFWVPPLIGKPLMRSDIRKNIEGVIREMLKRYSSARSGKSADSKPAANTVKDGLPDNSSR